MIKSFSNSLRSIQYTSILTREFPQMPKWIQNMIWYDIVVLLFIVNLLYLYTDARRIPSSQGFQYHALAG